MKSKHQLSTILFMCLSIIFVLSACGASADYDIRGTWHYILIDTNGNNFDEGTVTFSGSPTSGTYIELNFYDVEYTGKYQVKHTSLSLIGDENWQGVISDSNNISGTWKHVNGFSGTWSAVRQIP